MKLKPIVNFIFELGQLAFTPRSGWQHLRTKTPQNDAEHSARVGQIAFILAIMEGLPNPYRAAAAGLFHEIGETRTLDHNRISKRYVQNDEARAIHDQTEPLGEAGEKIRILWEEYEYSTTPAGRIAKDADRLEMMFCAKEYMESGYPNAVDWFNAVPPLLMTASAKKLAEELRTASSHDWWRNIKAQKTSVPNEEKNVPHTAE